MNTQEPVCPICTSTNFEDMNGRVKVRCVQCGSLERTRVAFIVFKRLGLPKPGMSVLHMGPEGPMYSYFLGLCGDDYYPADIDPDHYNQHITDTKKLEKIDLCRMDEFLKGRKFDLIYHSHVLEHVICNYTMVMLRLQEYIKPGGYHLFSVPMGDYYYEEDLSLDLSEQEKDERFGRFDHVRKFGWHDFETTLGALPGVNTEFSSLSLITEEDQVRFNIPPGSNRGSPIFIIR